MKTAMTPATGWQASLKLGFCYLAEKTRLAHKQHWGPLTIQRPFYPEGTVCHAYILHPPSGVVGGDQLNIEVTLAPQSHALLTTPGASKFYRSKQNLAEQSQQFSVDQACLEWLPQENIFFPHSHVNLTTTIHLTGESQYIGWEINCLGRPVIQESFTSGRLCFRTALYRDQRLCFTERLLIKNTHDLMAASGLRNCPVFATLLATPANPDSLQVAREQCQRPLTQGVAGVTIVNQVLIVRYLGHSVAEAQSLFRAIWQQIRPFINQCPATIPRIWAT